MQIPIKIAKKYLKIEHLHKKVTFSWFDIDDAQIKCYYNKKVFKDQRNKGVIMKKIKSVISIILSAFLLLSMGCNPDTGDVVENPPEIEQGNLTIFPKPEVDYAGDPIPYSENGKLYLYYIHDGRGWNEGYFHPWNLFESSDFMNWEDKGRVIAGTFNRKNEQDYGIGTGTVLKGHDGKYHAFYTGWNGYPASVVDPEVLYHEKIQHAVSDNLVDWTKIPEDGFFGGVDDFRDPHVVWVEEAQEYWMLVSTWYSAQYYKPVIKKYTSVNLKTWEYDGIFFDEAENNVFMECPTLMQYNGYWYFSYFQKDVDGTNARVTRYYYKKNLTDEWIKPANNYFDGAGFSAARLVQVGEKLIVVGWIGTKIGDFDAGAYTWAGNLASHELIQQENGDLKVRPVSGIIQTLNHETFYNTTYVGNGVNYSKEEITFPKANKYQYVLFDKIRDKAMRLDFKVVASDGKAGLTLSKKEESGYGEVCVEFDFKEGLVSFFNTKAHSTGTVDSQAFIALNASAEYDCVLLLQNDCFTLYVNGEKALSSRVYKLTDYGFGFFDSGSGASFKDIKFYE